MSSGVSAPFTASLVGPGLPKLSCVKVQSEGGCHGPRVALTTGTVERASAFGELSEVPDAAG